MNTTDATRLLRHVYGMGRGFFSISHARHEHGTKNQIAGSWHDQYYEYPRELGRAMRDAFRWDAAGEDVYFLAHLVNEKGNRKKSNAAPIRTFFGDLDAGAQDAACPPSALIETSDGHAHGFWQVKEKNGVSVETAERFNKRLGLQHGADPSGVDASQVLRIPGTHNWTRPGTPIVRLLHVHGSVSYMLAEFDQALPPLGNEARTQGTPKEAGAKVPPTKRHPYVMGVLAAVQRWGAGEEALSRIAEALNECELAEPLPAYELAEIVAHVGEFAPDDQFAALHSEDRCGTCEGSEEKAARALERAEVAEAKAHEAKRFLDDAAETVADPNLGPEKLLFLGVAFAHYRKDPALEHGAGPNRWRLTGKLAQRLCGVRNVKTARDYIEKLAKAGLLPVKEEPFSFTKRSGETVKTHIFTYEWPVAPAETLAETAERNERETLLNRRRRLKAKREARGDARRFNGCPDHPHARVKMRRHCSVCDRCLDPVESKVWTEATAAPADGRTKVWTVENDLGSKDWCGRPCPHGVQRSKHLYCIECDGVECANCARRSPGNRDAICSECLAKVAAEYSAPAGAAGGAGWRSATSAIHTAP